MKLDIDALGTFYEMADEGAGLAAKRLTPMTGLDTRVAVTRIEFSSPEAIRDRLGDGRRRAGMRTTLEGALEGTTLVLFDEASAADVAETVLADAAPGDREAGGQALADSAIREVGQIITSGFVDGWADVLDEAIDITAPEYVDGTAPGDFVAPEDLERLHPELALSFRSRIETVGTTVEFEHYLLPDHESLVGLFARRGGGGRAVEYEKLAGFDRMARRGASTVADHFSKLTGIDADVEVRRVNFVSLDAIPSAVSTAPHVSVAFSFDGPLSGYLMFLFDESSARGLVEAMTGQSAADGIDDLGQDALSELSNIMASGLLDGWANMLDDTIDHSTPAYVNDMGAAVADPLVVGLGTDQEFAFVFDTRITAQDATVDCDIYAIPDEADLEAALDRLDVARVDEVATQAEFATAAAGVEQAPGEVDGGDRA
jgi:chemotaxis protein CheC